MAQEKKMDESAYGAIVKEITSVGELIRTHQDEKQSVMDDFDKERARLRAGKISKKALASSVQKVNAELNKLDRAIKKDIALVARIANKAKQFTAAQSPHASRVSLSGIKRTANTKHHKRRR